MSRLIIVDSRDPVASRAFYDAVFPNAAEEKAKSVQSTIDFCIRLIGEGIEQRHGIGPWYFEQAHKQIAEREAAKGATINGALGPKRAA